jgi:hypothetical protein
MFQIRAYGYNGDHFCVTILPTIEDVISFVGPILWNSRKNDTTISFEQLGKDFWNEVYSLDEDIDEIFPSKAQTKLPLMGQDLQYLTFKILPFQFGEVVSRWSDD